ncbi:MAG: thioredoxin family protein [Gemmatimonadaceae bacterium]|nr:thioredoxin family protein [Gemmatimonadaceae bacterium]
MRPRLERSRNLRAAAGVLAVWASMALARAAHAQEHPIVWSLVNPPTTATQGVPLTVTLRATIPPGWHLYAITQPPGGPVPMAITTPRGSAFTLSGAVRAPEPEIAPDPNFNILTESYADSVRLRVRLMPRKAGATTLSLSVAYQTCTDRFCLPPTTDVVDAPVEVQPAPAGVTVTELPEEPAPPPPAPPTPAGPTLGISLDTISGFAKAKTDSATGTATNNGPTPSSASAIATQATTTASLPLFLWLAAVMGALSLLTPCVFPMIPITVSYFTRTSEQARHSPMRNAAIYALGIMATFTVLGMAIALLVGAGGINRFAANPWVNVLVTLIFIAFALNLFGLWQLTVPSSVLTRLTAASSGSRLGETAGILAMGLTFTLTSFTCTAPLVGTLLVMAAQGDWQWPLMGLVVFSGVFALPFFLLALMPSAVARLPRSGEWMNTVKVMMGFVELATAMKFLANADMVWQWGVVTRTVVLVVWTMTALAAAMYLLGWWPGGRARTTRSFVPVAFAAVSVLGAVWLARGLRGARLGELESFLPPPEGAVTSGTASVAGELSWLVNDYNGALVRAQAEGKPVLIDFTGYTCTNCRWMEANMFPRPEIRREMERFVRVRLYTDGQGEQYRAQQQLELTKFGTIALPYYAVVDARGNTQSQFLGMTRSSDEFLTFLRGTASELTQ